MTIKTEQLQIKGKRETNSASKQEEGPYVHLGCIIKNYRKNNKKYEKSSSIKWLDMKDHFVRC